ncbi:MAG: delta-60 repeat domain-containing protein [Verrucomicrobia bacterium]|nr:delta-60 repeat domain-containing protein [Verrucomicrobiota bacterium]
MASLAVQADGKILVGGYFTTLGGQPCNYLGRLDADGSLDSAFNPGGGGGISPYVSSLAVQTDGKILLGGVFTNVAGQPRNYLAGLNADGTLDSAFKPGTDNAVYALSLQADGKILLGGAFTNVAGQPRNFLARLINPEPATQSLNYDGAAITWLRGGASPEVWRTSFEQSANGLSWISLNAGTRIPGGWQLPWLSLPSGAAIRARGYVTGGRYNGSGWFVETLLQAPWAAILTGDGFFGIVANRFGFNIRGGGAPAVVVEVSSNLVHWSSISTNSLNNGATYFSDPDWTSTPQRFYRCRVSP